MLNLIRKPPFCATEKTYVMDYGKRRLYSQEYLQKAINIDQFTVQSYPHWIYEEGNWIFIETPTKEVGYLTNQLGVEISKYFKIPTVTYNLVKVQFASSNSFPFTNIPIWQEREPRYGLASINFRKHRSTNIKYIYSNAFLENSELYPRNFTLKKFFPTCERISHTDELFKRIIARDLITQEKDRNLNILFTTDGAIAPLYDYEDEYQDVTTIYDNGIIRMDFRNQEIIDNIRSDDVLQSCLEKAMELDIEKALCKILEENDYDIGEQGIQFFKEKDKTIKKMLIDFKVVK